MVLVLDRPIYDYEDENEEERSARPATIWTDTDRARRSRNAIGARVCDPHPRGGQNTLAWFRAHRPAHALRLTEPRSEIAGEIWHEMRRFPQDRSAPQ